jgi:hypothetical protein
MNEHESQWEEKRERKIEKEKEKEKDLRDTLKLWLRHNLYHKKNLDKMNPTTSINVTNGDKSGPHSSSKD